MDIMPLIFSQAVLMSADTGVATDLSTNMMEENIFVMSTSIFPGVDCMSEDPNAAKTSKHDVERRSSWAAEHWHHTALIIHWPDNTAPLGCSKPQSDRKPLGISLSPLQKLSLKLKFPWFPNG